MSGKIRILVAEDHLVARVGICAIINRQPDMLVVAEASNVRQAAERYRQHLPDVALLDLRMPLLSGVEVAIAIRSELPDAHLIALTSYGGDEDIRRTLAAGVRAYLTKDVLRKEVLHTIRTVHGCGTYLPPSLAAALEAQDESPALSQREIEVLEPVARELGAQDRTRATTVAIQRGIIHL